MIHQLRAVPRCHYHASMQRSWHVLTEYKLLLLCSVIYKHCLSSSSPTPRQDRGWLHCCFYRQSLFLSYSFVLNRPRSVWFNMSTSSSVDSFTLDKLCFFLYASSCMLITVHLLTSPHRRVLKAYTTCAVSADSSLSS